MTASRALRNAGDVSPLNVEKVRQAARDIGYVGNHVATSLSSQRTNLIGAVVPSTSNIVFAQVLSGIAEGIAGTGFQPVFGLTDYDAEREYETIRGMLSWRPAGLIVTGLDQPDMTRKLLAESGVPVVQIMDQDGDPIDGCVGFSQTEAGAAMARALLANGHRRFGYVGCAVDKDTRAMKRRLGFETALAEQGIELVRSLTSGMATSIETGRSLTRQFLSEGRDVDCIYFSNDDIAVGGLFHCMDNGIDVPGEILLTGFNGLDIVKALPNRIATSHTPRREIGRVAAEIILEAVHDKSQRARKVVVLEPRVDLDAERVASQD